MSLAVQFKTRVFGIGTLLGICTLVSGPSSAADTVNGSILRGKLHTVFTPYYAGTCTYPNGQPFLNEVLFVSNKVVKKRTSDSYTLTKIVGDSLQIEETSNSGETLNNITLSVRDAVLEHNQLEKIAIQLTFIVLNNDVAIYWRDLSVNEKYKQGVFTIDGKKLDWYCQGVGGSVPVE